MEYRNEKNRIQALKDGDPAALRGIILEGYQNLYVYASAVCEECHQEMVLMTEIYAEMWRDRDRLDPECQLDMILKKIMWKLIYVQYRNGKFRYCIDAPERSTDSGDRNETFVLSEWLTGLKPFDKKTVLKPKQGWRCTPDFRMALIRNVMLRISAKGDEILSAPEHGRGIVEKGR